MLTSHATGIYRRRKVPMSTKTQHSRSLLRDTAIVNQRSVQWTVIVVVAKLVIDLVSGRALLSVMCCLIHVARSAELSRIPRIVESEFHSPRLL